MGFVLRRVPPERGLGSRTDGALLPGGMTEKEGSWGNELS